MKQVTSLYLLTNICLGVCSLPHSVTAQISSDGTLSTTVTTDDAVNFLIENGDRSGSNLFHSFSEFSIPNLGSAYFNNNPDITNIFSRVTGGNISEIQGLIRANGTTNLFLINPAGIVFGENASLNIGGSFFASTAESVVFGDGLKFSAIEPQKPPLLTINITPGVQFGKNPGTIQVQGNGHNLGLNFSTSTILRNNRPMGLQVNSGQTLGLIGGDILVEGGNLTANQGRIELGSVAQSGIVNLTPTTDGFTLNYSEIENFGNLSFTQASSVDVSGEGSGNLHFQAGNIFVLEESIIISNILGAQNGGEVLIRASESVEIIGTDTGDFPTGFSNQGELGTRGNSGDLFVEAGTFSLGNDAFVYNVTSGFGNSGNININARNVQFTNGGQITSSTVGDGDGGNITLKVEDTLTIDGDGNFSISGILNEVGGFNLNGERIIGRGDGGDITINARNVQITNGGVITGSTFGDGDGGNITLKVEDTLTIDGDGTFSISGIGSQVGARGKGNGGDISINARSLQITNGGQISGSTFGGGDGSNIILRVEDTLTIDGEGNPNSRQISGFTFRDGDGSNVTLRVEDTLTIDGDGTFSISGISSQVGDSGKGNGGDININARNLQITNGGVVSGSTFGDGDGGNITLRVEDTLTIDGDGTFSISGIGSQVRGSGEGNGGDININARNLQITNGGVVSGSTFRDSDGGNIILRVEDTLTIDGDGSFTRSIIESQVRNSGKGDGGDININTRNLQITNGGGISNSTFGDGDGGNITLKVEDTLTIDGYGNLRPSNIASAVGAIGKGNGGEIDLSVSNLQITNGGRISGSTFGDGDAGNITLRVEDTLTIDGEGNSRSSSIISDSQTNAAAGSIEVTADSLTVSDRAQISVSNIGTGDAGNLSINAENIFLDTQGSLQGEVIAGSQANIDIASQFLLLRNNSSITTNAGAQADGGNITIDTVNLVALEDSDITANAVEGRGGNITITAQGLFLSLDSEITASSQLGLDGTITINNPNTESKLGISQLPVDTTDASQQIAEGCQWAAAENASSFTVNGKGGIPTNTIHYLIDEQMWLTMEGLPESTTSAPVQGEREEKTVSKPIVEANAMIINERGNVELVAVVPANEQNLAQVASSCGGEVNSQVSSH